MKRSIFLYFVLTGCIFFSCSPPKSEIMDDKAFEVVERFNKKCPMMVDSETRIDAIEVKKPNTVLYKYTLVNINVEKVDTVSFNAALRPGIINTLKTNPDIKDLRDAKANFEYYYKDKKGKFIYSFTVTPKDYKI